MLVRILQIKNKGLNQKFDLTPRYYIFILLLKIILFSENLF